MEAKELKIGDKAEFNHYGIGTVVDYDEVSEDCRMEYGRDDWVWVKMEKAYSKMNFLGFSHSYVVKLIKENKSGETQGEAPRNNDGRAVCYWCNIPTQKRGGGKYNCCPKCGL